MTWMNEKIGYSCNPGTTAPYCTFFLLKKGERKKGGRWKFLEWMLTQPE
jgi:hypothetical protein